MILLSRSFPSNYSKGLAFIIEGNQRNIGIIEDESNVERAFAPFLF
jgi:hypothetical protein